MAQTYEKGKLTRFHGLNHRVKDDLNDIDEGPSVVYVSEQLASSRGRTFVVGTFECSGCTNSWHSGRICTEIFFAATLSGGVQRFDVVVWNQQCRICKVIAVPDLEADTYVERVVFKLQLYLGRRDAVIPMKEEPKTKPHRRELCCACAPGVCKEEERTFWFSTHVRDVAVWWSGGLLRRTRHRQIWVSFDSLVISSNMVCV